MNVSGSTTLLMASGSPSSAMDADSEYVSPAMALMRSVTNEGDWQKSTVSSDTNSSRLIPEAVSATDGGSREADSIFLSLSWVSTLNTLMESISSSKKSIRYGSSPAKDHTSTIEPRLANCPGS